MNITKIMNKLIICKPKGYTYEKSATTFTSNDTIRCNNNKNV